MTDQMNDTHRAVATAIAEIEIQKKMLKHVLQRMGWQTELLHDLTTPEAIAKQKEAAE